MGQLAATYREMGKYTEAEKLALQAQEIQNKVAGEGSPLMNPTEKGMKWA